MHEFLNGRNLASAQMKWASEMSGFFLHKRRACIEKSRPMRALDLELSRRFFPFPHPRSRKIPGFYCVVGSSGVFPHRLPLHLYSSSQASLCSGISWEISSVVMHHAAFSLPMNPLHEHLPIMMAVASAPSAITAEAVKNDEMDIILPPIAGIMAMPA